MRVPLSCKQALRSALAAACPGRGGVSLGAPRGPHLGRFTPVKWIKCDAGSGLGATVQNGSISQASLISSVTGLLPVAEGTSSVVGCRYNLYYKARMLAGGAGEIGCCTRQVTLRTCGAYGTLQYQRCPLRGR